MLAAHDARVRALAEEVRARPADRRLTIGKAHPGHTPHDLGYKRGCHAVTVDGLDRVLSIDRERRLATVEGQLQLGRLCQETARLGLMPKVVPEYETFTISGLVNGLGLETSSHRHGVFPASAVALEVVLGSGEVVVADREQHADLLAHLPGSYGTLGVVTRVTLELTPARPFVRSRYFAFTRAREYVAAFSEALAEHEFVEGFVLAKGHYVLCAGDYSDHDGSVEVFDMMTPGRPWYYQHATEQARRSGEDLIPSYEYMFRHQRGLMWLAGVIADLKVFSRTRWGRALLDRQVEKRVRASGFKWNLPQELVERSIVQQDMGIRLHRLEEGIEYVERNFGVHPLWNCAVGRGSVDLAFAMPKALAAEPEIVVDIGIYGEPTVRGYRGGEALRELQKFVDCPSLWGVSYLTREELEGIYDFDSYREVRRKYHAEAFLPLEEKLSFMRPSPANPGRLPLWRLVNLWYDLRARGR